MNDLSSLIELVERAKGPDREIDALLAKREGWTFEKMKGDRDPYWRKPGATQYWERVKEGPPRYTSSIDAALALVERKMHGSSWAVSGGDRNIPNATLWNKNLVEYTASEAATPCLAILLVLLRALQSLHPASNE